MADINPVISIIILNANGLNNPFTRQKLSNWITNMIQLYTVYRRNTLDSKIQIRLKVKEWKKLYHTNSNQGKLE